MRIFFRYSPKIDISDSYDVRIINKDEFICNEEKRVKILEADSITFLSYL